MVLRSAPPALDPELLRRELRKTYAKIALFPARRYHLNTGRTLAEAVRYPAEALDQVPLSTVDSFSGAGHPLGMVEIRPGDAVLDVGCGTGLDALVAAGLVGAAGRVVGVDITPEAVQVARASAVKARAPNVVFAVGLAEKLPYPDESFDVVVSNNTVNNCTVDKLAVLREMHRVLKPGGWLGIADVVIAEPIPDDGRADIGLWTC